MGVTRYFLPDEFMMVVSQDSSRSRFLPCVSTQIKKFVWARMMPFNRENTILTLRL